MKRKGCLWSALRQGSNPTEAVSLTSSTGGSFSLHPPSSALPLPLPALPLPPPPPLPALTLLFA